MNNKEFSSLAKRLLPGLPGFVVKGPMISARPVGHILRAICFESSSFDKKSFYVWAFILPLFVPTTIIHFTLGFRVRLAGGADRWHADDPNLLAAISDALRSQALPFLESARAPGDAARAARSLGTDNPHVQEAMAYCLAKAGELDEAIRTLDDLLGMLAPDVAWEAEIAERARLLRNKLAVDPAQGQSQLDAWEDWSVASLRLEE